MVFFEQNEKLNIQLYVVFYLIFSFIVGDSFDFWLGKNKYDFWNWLHFAVYIQEVYFFSFHLLLILNYFPMIYDSRIFFHMCSYVLSIKTRFFYYVE